MATEEAIDFQDRRLEIDDDPESAVVQIVEEAAALTASDVFLYAS